MTGLTEPWAYVVVALLAGAESGAFLGLVLPGEAAMLFGGFLVYEGRADLVVMLVCGIAGAIAGDSLSYWIGVKAGPRLRDSWLGRRVGHERWDRALDFVRRRGGRAVLLGRFVGVLRALVPAIAGSAGVPYGTFLPYSVAGAAAWVATFIVLGSIAGGSWHAIERWSGRASLVLLAIFAIVGLAWWSARRVAGHREKVTAAWASFLDVNVVRSARRRYRRQIAFLRRRFDPAGRFGLYLTAGASIAVVTMWSFGELIDALDERDDIYVIDGPVERFFVSHRSSDLTPVMRALTHAGDGAVVGAVLVAAAIATVVRTGDARWAMFFAACVAGLVTDDLTRPLVDRDGPDVTTLIAAPDGSFPSSNTAAAATAAWALAYVLTRHVSWARAVAAWTVGIVVVTVVAIGEVYLGVAWPTDTLAGAILGAILVATAATGLELLRDLGAHRQVPAAL